MIENEGECRVTGRDPRSEKRATVVAFCEMTRTAEQFRMSKDFWADAGFTDFRLERWTIEDGWSQVREVQLFVLFMNCAILEQTYMTLKVLSA